MISSTRILNKDEQEILHTGFAAGILFGASAILVGATVRWIVVEYRKPTKKD